MVTSGFHWLGYWIKHDSRWNYSLETTALMKKNVTKTFLVTVIPIKRSSHSFRYEMERKLFYGRRIHCSQFYSLISAWVMSSYSTFNYGCSMRIVGTNCTGQVRLKLPSTLSLASIEKPTLQQRCSESKHNVIFTPSKNMIRYIQLMLEHIFHLFAKLNFQEKIENLKPSIFQNFQTSYSRKGSKLKRRNNPINVPECNG